MYTILLEIEETINSRPITPVSDDINDFQPLTPNHFLIGRLSLYHCQGKFTEKELNSKRKCKVNESLFKAKLPWDVDSPLPIGRAKRIKSLQPKTFEEDVRNSAKKEEKKRRRLRRINPEGETPHRDEIICLDSQEYIKSSDLYKLVATPRAVPDTPWIFQYINGSADETDQDEENEQIEKEADKENSPVRNSKGGPTFCKHDEVDSDGITHFEFKRPTILK